MDSENAATPEPFALELQDAPNNAAAVHVGSGDLLGGLGKLHEVWKYGGGTQSVAIAALILQGKLPRPDIAIIADTGKERSTTWQYLDAIVAPKLAEIDLPIIRAYASEHAYYHATDPSLHGRHGSNGYDGWILQQVVEAGRGEQLAAP